MGLGLNVGVLADLRENDEEGYEHFKSQFDALNEYLERIGLPTHHEPENCEVWSCSMYGYSGLHYLRRVAAHLDLTGKLPAPGDDHASDYPILVNYFRTAVATKQGFLARLLGAQRAFKREIDHLIVHSDSEGFYLPIDFERVLISDAEMKIAGGMVGSSQRLLSECRSLASDLEIPPYLDENSDELWSALASQGKGDTKWQRYGVESYSCICLMRACLKSVETGAAIVFG